MSGGEDLNNYEYFLLRICIQSIYPIYLQLQKRNLGRLCLLILRKKRHFME